MLAVYAVLLTLIVVFLGFIWLIAALTTALLVQRIGYLYTYGIILIFLILTTLIAVRR